MTVPHEPEPGLAVFTQLALQSSPSESTEKQVSSQSRQAVDTLAPKQVFDPDVHLGKSS